MVECHSAFVGVTLSEDSHRDAESSFFWILDIIHQYLFQNLKKLNLLKILYISMKYISLKRNEMKAGLYQLV